jgi:hypothetical protein
MNCVRPPGCWSMNLVTSYACAALSGLLSYMQQHSMTHQTCTRADQPRTSRTLLHLASQTHARKRRGGGRCTQSSTHLVVDNEPQVLGRVVLRHLLPRVRRHRAEKAWPVLSSLAMPTCRAHRPTDTNMHACTLRMQSYTAMLLQGLGVLAHVVEVIHVGHQGLSAMSCGQRQPTKQNRGEGRLVVVLHTKLFACLDQYRCDLGVVVLGHAREEVVDSLVVECACMHGQHEARSRAGRDQWRQSRTTSLWHSPALWRSASQP